MIREATAAAAAQQDARVERARTMKTYRRAENEKLLGWFRPWCDLQEQWLEADSRELEQVQAQLAAPGLAADEEHRLKLRRDALLDTVDEIVNGRQRWSQSLLYEHAELAGLKPPVGSHDVFDKRPSLTRTKKVIRELEKELVELEKP